MLQFRLQSELEYLNLHQIKAHLVIEASSAFMDGVSNDQILLPCDWKSQNAFTKFYFKVLPEPHQDLFFLWPVVAVQQIHHQKNSPFIFEKHEISKLFQFFFSMRFMLQLRDK